MQTNPAEIREEVPAGYDRIINGLFLFLFFIVPLSRSGIYIIASFLLIAWLIKKIKSWNLPHEKTGDLEIVRWVGYMGLAVLLSLLNAQNIPAALNNFIDEYLIYALIFIIGLDVIKSKEQLHKLLGIGLVALLIVAGVGAYEYFGLGYKRISSTFNISTQTGVYLTGVVLLNLAFLLFRKTSSRPALVGSFLLLFVGLSCLIMNGTRAAWLGFLTGTIFLLVLALKNNKLINFKLLIAIFLIMVLASLLFDFGVVLERIANITDMSDSSNRQRIMMLRGGWEMFKDHPLIGVGTGQFRFAYENYMLPGVRPYTHIHCFYLHLLVEIGLLGFFLFFTLVYKILRAGISMRARPSGEKSWFYYGVLGALIGIGVSNLFDWTFLDLQVGSFTVLLTALWLKEAQVKISSGYKGLI